VRLNLSAFVALFGFWLLLSGHYSPFFIGAGAVSAAAVVYAARRMEVVDREGVPIELGMAVVTYWPWLAWEIAKSAWTVSRIILHPRLPIRPTLVRFRPAQRTEVGLVTHANSITLTPGTIAVEATADEFLVHGLTRESAQGAVDSEMDRRVAALEGAR
jgi:multicomponent Na+:H+ antiporter subunit E